MTCSPLAIKRKIILLAANMGGEPSERVEMETDTTGNGYREGAFFSFSLVPGLASISKRPYRPRTKSAFPTRSPHYLAVVPLTVPKFPCSFLVLVPLRPLLPVASFVFACFPVHDDKKRKMTTALGMACRVKDIRHELQLTTTTKQVNMRSRAIAPLL